MDQLPITNDKRQLGVASLGDSAPTFLLVPFDEAFDREWTTDVHFACYGVIEPGEDKPTTEPYPRIRKVALGSIRDVGGEVVVGALALDMDLKDQPGAEAMAVDDSGKPTWSTDDLESFVRALLVIDEQLGEKRIASPLVYTTTHGARFVHKLTRVVVAEQAEDLLRGLHKIYADMGIVLDPLTDWTRLFRAPKVLRDGVHTSTQRWFTIRWGTGTTDADAIDPVSKEQVYRDRYADITTVTAGKPTSEEAHALLFCKGAGGREKQSDMRKLAGRILKGTTSYGQVFDGKPIASVGSRDSTLIKLVGSATNFLLGPLSGDYDFTPQDIYALFLAPVEDLDPDSGTPDWTESLWSKARSCYERENAKVKHAEVVKEAKTEAARDSLGQLLVTLRSTCDLPELHGEDTVASLTALSRMLLLKDPAGKFRAFTSDGDITHNSVPSSSLHALVRVAGLTEWIDLTKLGAKGVLVARAEQEIARDHAADVAFVTGAAGVQKSYLRGEEGNALELVLSLYRRNPRLEATFSQDVEDWLEVLTENPRELRRWLAYALDFEGGPICALSLAGAPAAGKGMLAQGLVETLQHPARADKTSLVGDFNSSLNNTPFLIVDEGLPSGAHDIADTFRSLTAGEPICINEKYQAPVTIRNPMRILFTANNLDVVEQLASHRVNDAKDQAALAARLLHLDVPNTAAIHLCALGGLSFTKGWVEGSAGQPSTFRLARHLLWLYENRAQYGEPGDRFLVEGRVDATVVQGLRLASRASQAVARAILTGLEDSAIPAVTEAMAVDDGHLFVTPKAIEEQHRQLRETNVQLNVIIITRVLRNMLTPGAPDERSRKTNMAGNTVRQRWKDIDVQMLWQYAEEAGYRREKLELLMIAQYGDEATE